jgi:tetratricopeptide (TPR) repeat protein
MTLLLAGLALLAPTFNKEVAPIVFARCAPCHHPGGSGPFSLLGYDDVKRHAQQIVRVTGSRFMPPWLPDPGFGEFAGALRLSDAEIGLIRRWVEEGAVEGRPVDLPAPPRFTTDWQLGAPDLVLTIPKAYTLPAEGGDIYRNFIFTFPLEGVRYVRALEIRPGNPRAVHHANLLIDRGRTSRVREGRDGQPGFPGMDIKIEAGALDPESHFLFWKPGSVVSREPDGMAWTVEKGTDLVLNMHLQPSGKPEAIRPSLGLYFTPEAPRFLPLLVQLENDRALDIPPGRTDFAVADEFTLPVDVDLLGVYPHAHYLGREVDGVATLPDGSRKPLIRIRRWDQNWQGVYRYARPVFLPKGTIVSMRWTYDNSSANPLNPNRPPRRVTAGDRSTDEMGHLWLQVLPRGSDRLAIQEALARKRIGRDPNDSTAHFNLGGVLRAEGKTDAAIGELREAVRLRPREEAALNTLGALLEAAGRVEEAEARYREALDAHPDYLEAHYNLANLLEERGADSEAIEHLRQVVRLDPEDARARERLAEALNRRAHAFAAQNRLADAARDFRELVELNPDDPDACTNLGVALARQGQYSSAEEWFGRAVRLSPQNEAARKNLERVRALLAK